MRHSMSTKRTSESENLSGRRVLVTRSAEQALSLASALVELGIKPVSIPTIEIVAPPSFEELDRALAELDRFDYLVLTSVNAVSAFFKRLEAKGQQISLLGGLHVVAVGPKSAEAIISYGVEADLVPEDYRAEGVVDLLKDRVCGKRLLYPKAALARDLIPAELTAAGAEVVDPVAYASAPPAEAPEKLKKALTDGLDLLTFTAASTIQNFVALLDTESLALARQIPVASIGPLTTAKAKKLGFNVVVEPDKSTLDGMVEAIKDYFSGHAKVF